MEAQDIIIHNSADSYFSIVPATDLYPACVNLREGYNEWTNLEIGLDIHVNLTGANTVSIEFDPTGEPEDMLELSFPVDAEQRKKVDVVLKSVDA